MSGYGMIARVAVIAALVTMSAPADAHGSLRCKGKLIRTGISVEQVISLCGKPRTRTVERIPVRSRSINGFSRMSGVVFSERLEYSRGWGRFPAVLTFREGILKRVDYLNYRADSS